MNEKFAYVELTFNGFIKEYLHNLVKEIVPSEKLYYSPVVNRINGDMTKDAHITLFYGLGVNSVENIQLKSLISSSDIKEVNLGEFVLFEGYQNLYKILCIEVLDSERKLLKLYNKIKLFASPDIKYELKPHITLAYVQPDYNLLDHMPPLPNSLSINTIQISVAG